MILETFFSPKHLLSVIIAATPQIKAYLNWIFSQYHSEKFPFLWKILLSHLIRIFQCVRKQMGHIRMSKNWLFAGCSSCNLPQLFNTKKIYHLNLNFNLQFRGVQMSSEMGLSNTLQFRWISVRAWDAEGEGVELRGGGGTWPRSSLGQRRGPLCPFISSQVKRAFSIIQGGVQLDFTQVMKVFYRVRLQDWTQEIE